MQRFSIDHCMTHHWHHGITMASYYMCINQRWRDIQLLCNKRFESCSVQCTCHSHDSVLWKTALPIRKLDHFVKRVCDDDQDAMGRILYDIAKTPLDKMVEL